LSAPPPKPTPPPLPSTPAGLDAEDTTCPRCAESHDLAKVKGCIKCLKCGFKFDCNGW
jgi:ribosomal protein S27AE